MIYKTFIRLGAVSFLFLLFIVAGLSFLSNASLQTQQLETADNTSKEEVHLLALEGNEVSEAPVIQLASLSLMTDYPVQDFAANTKRSISDTDDRLNRAKDLVEQGQFDEALNVLKTVQAADQNDYAVKFLQARILSWAGNHYEAEQTFMALTQLYPKDSDIAVSYAYLYLYQNKFSQAEQLFAKVLTENPDYKDAQDGLKRARSATPQ